MNWTIGRWSDAKTHAKFCLPDKKESHSCIGLWQAMKSGSIFRILNARNLGLIPSNHQHLPQNQIASDGRRCCVWWDQEGVIYYELLKPGETVNAHHYQQLIKLHRALREKRLHYRKRHDKLIFFHDNAPSHMSIMIQNYLETQQGSATPSCLLTDLAPFDYHLFSSMGHALAERHFDSYEDVRKWLDEWFASKDEEFFWRVYTNCPKNGKNL